MRRPGEGFPRSRKFLKSGVDMNSKSTIVRTPHGGVDKVDKFTGRGGTRQLFPWFKGN
jgi:hypothetical protein